MRTELLSELATTLLGLGTAYYELDRYDEALAALRERLEVLARLSERNPYRVGITLRDIGKVYCRQGDLNKAQSYFEQAREELLEIEAPDTLLEVLLQVGQVYTELGSHNKALVAYEEGLEMAKALPQEDAHLKGVILYKMGQSYAALKSHSEAIDCFEQATQILRGAGAPLEIVIVLENLETIYKVIDQEDKAAEMHRAIETTLTEVAKSTDIRILQDLASYYIERERLSDAKIVLDQANTLLEQHPAGEPDKREIRDLGLSYRRLGRAYEQEQMYDEALTSYLQADQLVESKVGSQVYGVLMHNIGDVYQAQKKFDQALIYYEKARKYKEAAMKDMKDADDPHRLMRDLIATLHTIADVHAEINQHEKALAVYKEALEKQASLSK